MQGLDPKPLNPRGAISQRGLLNLAKAAQQFGVSGGIHDSIGSTGITPHPYFPIQACWAFIDDVVENRHAWTEGDVSDADNVIRLVGGMAGTIDTDGSGSDGGTDYQPAYDLNGGSYDIDTFIYIVRINWNAWAIVGGSSTGSGSGGGTTTTVTCSDGTVYPVTISGTSITVGNAL